MHSKTPQLFNMPNWINHIEFGIVFLVFPILDGITTNIALTKYGEREANTIMAWVIKDKHVFSPSASS
jgi:hypothetical protein